MKTISIFNNKGGVGKTTYMYHVAHMLSRRGHRVLMVDCDSQSNLTSYALSDTEIRASWREDGNSIYRAVEPVIRGVGDIRKRQPSPVANAQGPLFLIPGDLRLSDFEDLLGDTWNSARGGSEASLRAQSAIHRYIHYTADRVSADLVLIDLGPNLAALNRAVLASSDFFITPVAPDLFSIQGTENLGNKLVMWRAQWDQCNSNWSGEGLSIPKGHPVFLGYVIQMHNIRTNSEAKMTAGWSIYGNELEEAIKTNIVDRLSADQVAEWEEGNYKLGMIPNLHSLVPYSLDAKKPIFDCKSKDGLRGSHLSRAKDSAGHFEEVVETIENVLAW